THHELPRHQQSNDLAPLRTLGRSIVEGDAKWDGDPQFTGEFHYTKGYWEWTEDVLSHCGRDYASLMYMTPFMLRCLPDHNSDIIKAFCKAWCPLTNTLLTSVGELSISLWDLHDFTGLPVTGCLYDEVVPSALELTGADEKGGRFIPRSNKYLVYAYHLLQGADDDRCSNVSIDKWVKFWSNKAIKYHMPPPRKENKTVRPKSTHNPLGDITTHKRWSIAEEALFKKLCIKGNLKEEVYLAAYLACWLCMFVLPSKDVNSIRPSTFKMASMMANGRQVSLAIPVLASIYEGLNTVATSSKPARTSPSFPVHFVYAWLAFYFKTHYPVWQGLRGPKMTIFSGEGGAKYYNPQEAHKRIHKAEFVSWTCNMIVKNRPFKFVDNADAEELDHNFFVAIRSSYLTLRQGDKFIIEPTVLIDSGVSLAWWAKVHGTFLDENIACLISPKLPKIILKRKRHGDNQVDDSENNPSPVPVPPIVVKSNSQAEVVKRKSKKMKSSPLMLMKNLILVIRGLRLLLLHLPPPVVSVFEDEARSLSSHKLSRSLHAQRLKEAEDRLQDVEVKANEGASKAQSLMDELEHVEKEIVALKGRRTSLCAALKGQKQLNHDAQAKVNEVKKNVAALKNTAPLDDAIVEDLESSKANIEDLKKNLKSLNPFA
ncbi:UNVERIFIED_CONTAM: hypothetical protein Sradi_1693600, partial [Sesamum radiatum]